jgi:ADP-heptose:LPS heptosyltransferase
MTAPRYYTTEGEAIHFAPFHGEFGWEVMSWAPYCRAAARGFRHVTVTSFAETEALYADFCTDFQSHGSTNRTLDYPKSFSFYRAAGEHRRYGRPGKGPRFDVLIHARAIRRKASINYAHWPLVVGALVRSRLKVACIGTAADEAVPPAIDARAAPLPILMDLLANARLCVGVSSGTMHLAAACGCPLLVWGDIKTRYRETLRARYETTWNPHRVPVAWLDAGDWQPDPSRVLTTIADLL